MPFSRVHNQSPSGVSLESRRPPAKVPCPWRTFFSLTGGSIFYCLSAMSIMYGMAKLLSPVLAEPDADSGQLLPCLGTLGIYELALLAVLTLIVVRRAVTNDAVSLVVLVALFLSVSGLMVAFMPQKEPGATLAVGLVCLSLAAGTLTVMRRFVGLHLPRLFAVGIGLHLAWCFLLAPVMSFVVGLDSVRALWRAWINGWFVLLSGVSVLLLHAWRTPTGAMCRADRQVCFLRSPAMAWIFAAILVAVSCLHNHALTYIFDLRLRFSDFLPLIALVCALGVELMRAYGKRFGVAEIVVAAMPLLLIAVGSTISPVVVVDGTSLLRLPWHPAILSAAMGGLLVAMARREERSHLLFVAMAYGIGVILTAGKHPVAVEGLNWGLCGLCLLAGLFAIGIWRRSPQVLLVAILFLAVGMSFSEQVTTCAEHWGLTCWGIPFFVVGVGVAVLQIIFRERVPALLALAGGVELCLGTVLMFLDAFPLAGTIAVGVLGGAVWYRTRTLPVPVGSGLPLVHVVYKLTARVAAWRFVVLSFVLLGFGLIASWRKGRADEASPQSLAVPDHPPVTSFDRALFIVLMLHCLVFALMPACTASHRHPPQVRCMGNLCELGKAMKMWSMDSTSSPYPPSLACLQSEGYASNPRLYVCPFSDTSLDEVRTNTNVDAWSDYVLVTGLREQDPDRCVHIHERLGNHHNGGVALYLDGAVRWHKRREFERLLSTPSRFFGTTDPKKIADLTKRTGRFQE